MEPLDQISILLVDDRPDKLLSLEAVLSDLPLRIVRANSGSDALRALLTQQFALILLDIDMPTMDGFETAKLIRTRRSSRDTPIIFVTAYQDEVFMARGYSLGAVDYILQPVIPEILRSKVSVFVDLYRKTQMVMKQAEWQHRRALQLQNLAAASVAINAAPSMEKTLQVITDSARDVVGSHQAITLCMIDELAPANGNPKVFSSFSKKYTEWSKRPLNLDRVKSTVVVQSRTPIRMTEEELHRHPDWEIVRTLDLPPIRGMVAVPLLGRLHQHLGVIYLSDKIDGDFTADDQAILVQLAQMAAVAIENILSAEAREANRAKDQFIAVLSHELRTPLTPVLATLSAIDLDENLPDNIREDLRLVHRNVKLEARLIDDLLDLTRISKGKIELHVAPIDLHELTRHALSICNPDALEKELQISIRLAAKDHFVKGDATRLQQVLWNLIKNAIKFTPRGGTITISSANASDNSLDIKVADTGIGIEADVFPRIFTAFNQGNSIITRQFGGLGLGLAISKAIVDRHSGTITVESPGAGLGATFSLALPITHERPAKIVEDIPAVPRHTNSRPSRILFVEDHRDTARVLTRLLRDSSYQVDWASTIAEALQFAGNSEYDLLISDIGLPDGSGLELMRELQSRRPITGIALSGFGMEDDVQRSKMAGFKLHLSKPIDYQVLLERIQELTTGRPSAPVPAA